MFPVPVPAWVCWFVEHWKDWAIRLAAALSLIMHILVLVLADFRRYNRTWPVFTLLLWLAYLGLDKVGSYALSHLSLDDTGDDAATAKEQLAVAFWAPFLLLHLGGPDNIGAYSLDDDKLGWRKAFGGLPKALGALYVVFTKIWLVDDTGLLILASGVMVVVGIARFAENVWAMIRALRTKKQPATKILRDSATTDVPANIPPEVAEWLKKLNEKAAKIYEKVYTKAGQVYSVGGYILRLLAPLATATAFILFGLYPKDCLQAADVWITYILMFCALVLDVVWLVAALASNSAKEFLEANPGIWFRHQILCSGWWYRLHRVSELFHVGKLFGMGSSTYGSDFIGRFDLLLECTRAPPGCIASMWSELGSFFRQDDSGWSDRRCWKSLLKLQPDVKEELFERIKERLSSAIPADNKSHADAGKNDHAYSIKEIRKYWGQAAVKKRKKIKLSLFFGSEFQEDILLWHMATSIYLCSSNINLAGSTMRQRVRAIEAVSEYLMFLLAARPHMLPDPPLQSLYEVTQQALQELYKEKKANGDDLCCASKKKQLADILRFNKPLNFKNRENSGDDNRRLIWYAAELANQLQKLDLDKEVDVVDLVFDVWVDKLLYAGIKCNRDSHARQLGKGGELVTIAWIAVECTVSVFPIAEIDPEGTPGDNEDGPHPLPKCPKKKINNNNLPECPIGKGNDKPPKCPSIEQPTCHCHEGPHTCCMQEYCYCTQHYYYC